MKKTVIAIVSYNSKRYMQECLNSIRSRLKTDRYLVSVVDNASTDGIAEWLMNQPDILLTQNTKNIGFGPACNQAVKATLGTEFEDADVFLLNNDTVMTSTALPRMLDALYSTDDIGAVGAMSNYAGNRQQLEVSFPSTEEYIQYGESLDIPYADSRIEKVRLNGFAMLVRRDVWDKIGGFDEDFAPGYYEDDALSMEILKLGYRLILSRDSFIYHVGSASFVKTGLNNLSFEHHDLFIKKYGFDILNYVYPCGAVMAQIPFDRSDSFNVLHLGCGLGAEIKAIHSLFPKSYVYGIETQKELFEIASKTENIYKNVSDAYKEIDKASINLLIVDSDYLQYLSDEDKHFLVEMCAPGAIEIGRLHNYDDYPFDAVKLILWDSSLFSEKIAGHLESWGIMSSTYTPGKLSEKIDAYGIPRENILVLDNGSIVPYLTAHFSRLPITDPTHSKALKLASFEKRLATSGIYISKEVFLNTLGLTISIYKDCCEKVDDIASLLEDCYLLDYVKEPYDKAHLSRLIEDDWNDCAYITARDKYSDYGIVGFYCFNERHQKMLCFAFSWSVTDLGIEQYIYNLLGCPDFQIIPPVLHPLESGLSTPWLQYDNSNLHFYKNSNDESINILLKGDKSLQSIEDYLVGGRITCEYDDISALTRDNPISQVAALSPTKLYTGSYQIVIFSLMQYNYDVWETDSEGMLSGLFETLDSLCEEVKGNPAIILLLGSEIPYSCGCDNDKKLAELHAELRPVIEDYALTQPKIRIINITDYIKDQSDFGHSVNTFSVRVYSDIVEQIVVYINEKVDQILSSRS